ncbi:membrane protein [Sphingomonas astaxanthinifaciens DSM 22298]|uniref:Membrane protein n=2 Tax=Sphingomonas TaxID=13687 RepID=A0ABQ5Z7S3_9SPHN|nr:membrane protein [Sphingomonas astaxanthinifaciens DSM 22298]
MDATSQRTSIAAGLEWLALIMSLTVGTSIAAIIMGNRVGIPVLSVYWEYVAAVYRLAPLILVALAIGVAASVALRREARPIAAIATMARARFHSREELAATVGPVLLMPLLLGAFGALKQLLPIYRPFEWDDTFAGFARYIFFGRRGWEVTHGLFSSPEATLVLDRIYTAWVPMLFAAVLLYALFAPAALRARFFLSLTLGFVLIGVVSAFFFSSAGPCYARLIGTASAPAYDGLMARLHAIDAAGYHLQALEWQKQLWIAHEQREYGFAMGISAMPSMHNAVSFLYVLTAWRARPLVRIAAWSFALLILIGSVHLGWHYIADGLVAWAMMGTIWIASSWALRVWRPLPAPIRRETAVQPA